MTEKTAAILANPHPNTHIVYPHADDAQVVEAITFFVAEGLARGESAVLIITGEKQTLLEKNLSGCGYDAGLLRSERRLIFFDAATLIESLFVNDIPSAAAFEATIGTGLRTARDQAPNGKVRLYGEMVNLLCSGGHVDAAVRIEELWNTLDEAATVPLLCTYSLATLRPLREVERDRLLRAHTCQLAS